ncbi:MAG: redoxin domain-containing protein [bacterium]|nr:redoxin domain-containing protein [bacterium]
MSHKPVSCAVLMLSGLVTFAGAEPAEGLRNVSAGDPFPSFSVQTADGQVVGTGDLQGKTLLLVFVRPGQPSSQEVLSTAQEILSGNEGGELRVLAVSTDKEAKPGFLTAFAKEHGLSFSPAMDPQRKLYGDCGVVVVPTALLIDGKNNLRYEQPQVPPGYATRLRLNTELLLGKLSQDQFNARLAEMTTRKSKEEVSRRRRLGLARRLAEDEQLAEAVAILAPLLSEHASPRVAALLGECHLRLGQMTEAADCLRPYADLPSAPPGLKLVLGRLEVGQGNDERAEKYLLEAIERAPRKGPALFELGRLYERRQEPSRALRCYRRALEEIYGVEPTRAPTVASPGA